MAALAKDELSKIGIIDAAEVIDSTVFRMEKTYPAYFGTYRPLRRNPRNIWTVTKTSSW